MRRACSYSRFRQSGLLICLALALTLTACAQPRYVTVEHAEGPEASGFVYADVSFAFDACMARCDEDNPLGFLTREGCFKGCFEARRQTYQSAAVFSSPADCYAAMEGRDLNRDLYIEDAQAWCDGEYTHLHKLQGCRDAMAAFHSALSSENMCGGATPLPVPTAPPAENAPVAEQPLPKGTYTTPPADPLPASSRTPVVAPVAGAPYPVDTPKYQASPARRSTPPPATTKPAPAAPAPVKKDAPASVEKDAPMKDSPLPGSPAENASPSRLTPIQAAPPVGDANASAPAASPEATEKKTSAPSPDPSPAPTPAPSPHPSTERASDTGQAASGQEQAAPAAASPLIPPVPSMLGQGYNPPPLTGEDPGPIALPPIDVGLPPISAEAAENAASQATPAP